MPGDAAGWVLLITSVVGAMMVVGTAVVRTARAHIKTRVEIEVQEQLGEELNKQLAPITKMLELQDSKIDGVRLNQTTISEEVGKVRDIAASNQRKLENGLAHAVEDLRCEQRTTASKVDRLLEEHMKWSTREERNS